MSWFKNSSILFLLLGVLLNAECVNAQENTEQGNEQLEKEINKSEEESKQKVDIQADTFSYSEDGKELEAKGNVFVTSEYGTLQADKLIFNQQADKIYAIGNVVYVDTENNKAFAEEFELTGDFKKGVAKRIMVMLADSTGKLRSEKAVKVNEIKLNLYDADYTSCVVANPEDTPAWQLNADKVIYNSEDESVLYKNAILDLYGLPILYSPVFYHSTNPDKPVTGFLMPSLESSGDNGFGAGTGFFWAVDDRQDVTIKAKYYSKRGLLGALGHRYVGKNISTNLYAEGIADKEDDRHVRGIIRGSAEYVFNPGQRVGLNSVYVSDDEYLEEFKEKTDAYLYSIAYAEQADEKTYLGVSSRYFQDLRRDTKGEDVAQPYGRLQFEKLFDVDDSSGQIKLAADMLTLQREKGQDTNRINTHSEYIKPFYTPDGSLFEFRAGVRADYYRYNTHETLDSDYESETRLLPEASLSWEKPYVSSSFRHTISPKLMVIASPRKEYKDIPNEDSTSFELDTVNLFELNRFSGWDKVETGTRVVYGLDSKYGMPSNLKFQAFLGQSYNFSVKEEDINDLTSNNKNSDWVGFVNLTPNQHVGVYSSFRLDSSNLAAQRIDSGFVLQKDSDFTNLANLEKDSFRIVHSFLKDDSEEINVYGFYNLNEKVALKAHVERNLISNITLKQEIETIYNQGCYKLSFKVRKKQSEDPDVENSLDFLFNFSILPTGK